MGSQVCLVNRRRQRLLCSVETVGSFVLGLLWGPCGLHLTRSDSGNPSHLHPSSEGPWGLLCPDSKAAHGAPSVQGNLLQGTNMYPQRGTVFREEGGPSRPGGTASERTAVLGGYWAWRVYCHIWRVGESTVAEIPLGGGGVLPHIQAALIWSCVPGSSCDPEQVTSPPCACTLRFRAEIMVSTSEGRSESADNVVSTQHSSCCCYDCYCCNW